MMSDGLLSDYCDGKLFRENKLFQEDPTALQIQLYYDELEVCNPLGSKAKKHKLGNFVIMVTSVLSFFLHVCYVSCITHLVTWILNYAPV